MATIIKREGSRYYYAAYRVPIIAADGSKAWKQVRKCTKQTSPAAARRAADDFEQAALKANGAGSDGSRKLLELLRQATEDAGQNRLTHDLARQYLRKIAEAATGQPLQIYSARQWFNEWLAQASSSTKPATYARYKHSITIFLGHIGELAEMPLDHLTIAHLRKFRDKLKDEGRTAKTANHYLKDVSAALRAAAVEGLILRSPAAKLKQLPTKDSTVREVFTLEEIGRLLQAAPSQQWRGLILLGAFGGLRLGDAAKLKWSSVDNVSGTIKFTTAKTGKEILLPMHGELKRFFTQHKPTTDSCFADLASVSISGCNGLSARFVRIMESAGIKRNTRREKVEGKAGHRTYDRSFHSLRHTFNSLMANHGISQELRMKLVGHSDTSSNDIYSHHEIATLRAAVDAVPLLAQEGQAQHPLEGASRA